MSVSDELDEISRKFARMREQRAPVSSLQIVERDAIIAQKDALLAEMAETIRDMLLAADITWTERNLGHDWADAVRKAMDILAKYEAQKGETTNG